jgi:hypothetical protein
MSTKKIILIIIGVLLLCCLCSVVAGVLVYNNRHSLGLDNIQFGFISPVPTSTTSAPGQTGADTCQIAGCSGQFCLAPEDLGQGMTTCVWQDVYSCYVYARCERQADGNCGWTKTTDYMSCVSQYQ